MELIKKIKEKKQSLHGIRNNVITQVMIFVISIVVGFEFFSYYIIRDYNESSVVGIMLNQAKYNQELYINYLSSYSLDEVIVGDKDQFYRNNNAQVQILDNTGILLFDSLAGNKIGEQIESDDVKQAKKGGYAFHKDKNNETGEVEISLSYALSDGQNQVGILRLTSSLDNVNNKIKDQMTLYVAFGFIVILIAFILSTISSEKLVKPIKNLTETCKKLAKGNFNEKSEIESEDEIGELAKTLNFMSDNILKKEDLKNEFISSVSHELRTPLTSIKGWAITLQSRPVQEDKEMLSQGLSVIEKESDRLSLMVEDLLDFSRLSSSSMTYDKKNLNIVQVVEEVYNQLIPRANNSKIEFKYETVYRRIDVFADENRMKEVFINIIDNAIKFTNESGLVKIFVDQNDEDAVIKVVDTGEGIKEDEIDLVTSKFYKGSSSKSQTGLGLSICEEILKAHEGNLEIESQYQKGTTVTINIPKVVEDEKN
ncbi:MAG: HAMP domain-containing sensor histidine kinase [Tissierellia bacterium]|nr:HAMP domain-containing sensor histidine kinase [Tissierellia bacterium]